MSIEELHSSQDRRQRRTLQTNALAFVVGLALVSTLFGAFDTYFGRFLASNQQLIGQLAGLVTVVFGLLLLEVIRIPWVLLEARLDLAGDSPAAG